MAKKKDNRGAKPLKKRFSIINSWAHLFINSSQLSYFIYGKRKSITKDDPISEKYRKDFEDLYGYMEKWLVNFEKKHQLEGDKIKELIEEHESMVRAKKEVSPE